MSRQINFFRLYPVIIFFVLLSCSQKKPVAPDTTPPHIKRVFSIDTTRVLISFDEPVNSEVAKQTIDYVIMSYETLAVNNVEIDPLKMRCILMTVPQESTIYNMTVRNIKDVAGNRIKDTTVSFLGIGLPLDSIPPSVHIIEPQGGDTLIGFEYFSVNATDNQTGIKNVNFYLGDSLVGQDTTFPYYIYLDVRNLPEGSLQKVYALADDYGRNTASSETLTVFIGTHPPFPYVVLDTIPTGYIPMRMDITADGKELYFAKIPDWPYSSSSELVMFNTEDTTTETMVSLDPAVPIYFLDVYGNNYVYFTHGNFFSVYDIPLETVTNTVDIGSPAGGIARANNGNLYISRKSKDDIVVYSIQGNSIVDSIPVPGGPSALAVDTIHSELYICPEFLNVVTVIDMQGDSVIANIALSECAYEIILSPEGDRAYVSEMNNSSIGVINTLNHLLLNEFSPNGLQTPKGLAVTDDGEHLFVTSLQDKVLVINTLDYTTEWNFTLGLNPYSVVFSPDGTRCFVICQGNQELYWIGY